MSKKEDFKLKSLPRKDALDKVLGKAEYAGDIKIDGMLYGKVLRSIHPHAIIKGIKIDDALNLEGVECVLTYKDIPGINKYGLAENDQQVLAPIDGKVRFIGDPIALVAAKTVEIAEKAKNLIKVEYELLEGVFDPIEALKEGVPQVHDSGNLLQKTKVRKGDIKEGKKQAAYVTENYFETQMVEHAYIEPEVTVANINKYGKLDVWTSTQYTFRDRRQIAPVLGFKINDVQVHQSTTGGGFGGKDDITTEIHASLLALATKKPVKLILDRKESFDFTTKRHPVKVKCKRGIDKNGKLVFLEGEIYGDTGAAASLGMYVIKKLGIHLSGPYEIPNIKVDTYTVYTNNTPAGAMRGFGVVQAAFCHESQMDILARDIGMDLFEFRDINALDIGKKTSTGQELKHSVGIRKTIEEVKKAYNERRF